MLTAEPAASELVLLLPLAAAVITSRPLALWLLQPEVQQLAASACTGMLQLLAGLGRQHVGLRLLICRVAQRIDSKQPAGEGGPRPLLAAVDALAAQQAAGSALRAGVLQLARQLQEDAGMEAQAEAGPTGGLLAGWAAWRSASLALCAQVYQRVQAQHGLSLAEVQRGQLHRLLAAGLQGAGSGGAPGVAYGAGASHLLRARTHAATLLRMLAATIKKQHLDVSAMDALDEAMRCASALAPAPAPAAPQASPARPAASPLLSRVGASAPATPVRRPPRAGLPAASSPALPADKLFAALMGQPPADGSSAPAAQPATPASPAAPAAVPTPAAPLAAQQSPLRRAAAHEAAAHEAWELYREPLLLLFRVSRWRRRAAPLRPLLLAAARCS